MITTLDFKQLERFFAKLDQKKGGGGGYSPPPAPDPVATAQAQGAANKEAAIASQELNMINQRSPYGNLDFSQTGTSAAETPQYTATSTLSPSGQRQLDLTNQAAEKYGQTANQQLNQVSGQLSQPVNFGGLGQAPTADLSSLGQAPTADFSSLGQAPTASFSGLGAAPIANYDSLGSAPVANEQTRQAVRQSIQDREQPYQERKLDQLRSRLDTQGIAQGSKAYSDAMFDYNRGLNDFNLGADKQALSQMSQLYGLEADQRNRATSEIGQLYGLEADQRNRATSEIEKLYGLQSDQRGRATNEIGQQFDFSNQARDRALRDIEAQYRLDANARDRGVNELVQQRQIPLNELAAMLSGSQVQGPSFINTPQQSMQAGDIQGATYANYNAANNAYNQQRASQAQGKGATGDLIGSLAMAGATAAPYISDRRLKENIRKIGQLANGLFVYVFNYIWGGPEQIGVMSDEVRKIMPHAVIVHPDGYDMVNYEEVLS